MGIYISDPGEFQLLDTATLAYEKILEAALARNKILTDKMDLDKRLTSDEIDEVNIELGRLQNFRQRLLDGEPAIKPKAPLEPHKEKA